MVGEGSATAVEPVDDILIGFDLLVVTTCHQALRIFGSHARHIEIGKAAGQQVVIEGVGADMTQFFLGFRDFLGRSRRIQLEQFELRILYCDLMGLFFC